MAGYGYNSGGYSARNGLGPQREDWSYKTSYAPNQNSGEYYSATKTEAYSPLLNENKQRSPVRFRQPSSSVPYQPQGAKEYFLANGRDEASRPERYPPVNTSYLNQTPNSYQVDTTGDWRSGEWSKPKGNMISNDVSDGYYRKSETETKPEIINSGGWPRPNKAMWATPPETSPRKPTGDIGTALEFMKEAAKVAGVDSSNSRYAIPASTASRTHETTGMVDKNEGQRRYGNVNLVSRAKEAYTGAKEVYRGISKMKTGANK